MRYLKYLIITIICGVCTSNTGFSLGNSNKIDVRNSDFELQTYTHKGRTLQYMQKGDLDKPLVLLVHGAPGSWKVFESYLQDKQLLKRFTLISVSRPGYGEFDSGNYEQSIKQQANFLSPLLEKNHSNHRTILVGHSYGGPVVSRMAMDYPDKIGGLVLIAPALDPSSEKMEWYQRAAGFSPLMLITPKSIRIAHREIRPLKEELNKMLPYWSKIRIPVTLIHGDKDQLVPVSNAEFARKVLVNTNPRILKLSHESHAIPWTRPKIIRAAILDILNQLEN